MADRSTYGDNIDERGILKGHRPIRMRIEDAPVRSTPASTSGIKVGKQKKPIPPYSAADGFPVVECPITGRVLIDKPGLPRNCPQSG